MQGFTLLEVLVALFILSFGLLGIAGLQLTALQQSQDSYAQSLAVIQLFSMQERLRANKSAETRNRELADWNASNARLLSHGKGSYQCQANVCVITIRWQTHKEHMLSLSGYL
jgi:type IV pilus assembly protein PilV